MPLPHALFILPLLLPAALVALAAEPPPTKPTSRPSTVPAATIQKWFEDLEASDAAVREESFTALLALTRADLPRLRAIVQKSRPVAPSQAAVLHDVVTHVYLTGEIYDANPRSGFLGVLKPDLESVEAPTFGDVNELGADRDRARTGVPVEYRLPGFCAFRALREGDVVLGTAGPTPRRFRNWNELSMSVISLPAGETVTFQVLRAGKMLDVPIRLDSRPVDAGAPDNRWEHMIMPAREAMAEEYWTEHFLPLIEERISSAVAVVRA